MEIDLHVPVAAICLSCVGGAKNHKSRPRIFEGVADVSVRSLIFRALVGQISGENPYKKP